MPTDRALPFLPPEEQGAFLDSSATETEAALMAAESVKRLGNDLVERSRDAGLPVPVPVPPSVSLGVGHEGAGGSPPQPIAAAALPDAFFSIAAAKKFNPILCSNLSRA
jgi:hypothetical protein